MPGGVFHPHHPAVHDAHCGSLAKELDCRALITGENLGQVASQTMEALGVSEDVPTCRCCAPLIGMDKEEIVRIARHIGTFDTSILPYEDCCTVFTPGIPRPSPMWRRSGDRERAGHRRPDREGHEREREVVKVPGL